MKYRMSEVSMLLTFAWVVQLPLVSGGGRVVEATKQMHHPQTVHKPSLQRRWTTQVIAIVEALHQGWLMWCESWRVGSSHVPYLAWVTVRKHSIEQLPGGKW